MCHIHIVCVVKDVLSFRLGQLIRRHGAQMKCALELQQNNYVARGNQLVETAIDSYCG